MSFATNRPGAIVLGGNFVGLGVVRSLAAHNIPTWVIAADRSKTIAQFSRFTARFIETTEPVAEVLLRLGRENGLHGWVLLPVADEYVEVLSANYESLSSIYRVTTAPEEVIRFALDKRQTYQRADELGIETPWTSVGSSFSDFESLEIPFPAILKPAINHHFFPQTNIKAVAVENYHELQRAFAQMCRYIPPLEILVQERIPGDGESQFSFCALCENGRVKASLVAQRRRQYPVDFGNASTFVETIRQPAVEESGRRFLEGIGFDGIAEVEFKFDSRDGKYKILDVNPRGWGWHALGKAAGIDFPYLLWQHAVGLPGTPAVAHQDAAWIHAAWIREITDVVAIAKSRDPLSEIKKLVSALVRGNLTFATFSFSDPLPFFAEFALWIWSGVSRQKTAKNFLQLEPPISPADELSNDFAGPSAGDSVPGLIEEPMDAAPMVARFPLSELEGRKPQYSGSQGNSAVRSADK